mgnify:CR=1 FL=1
MMGGQLANLIFAEVGKIKPPKMGNFTPLLTPIVSKVMHQRR